MTKAERERVERAKALGCVACRMQGTPQAGHPEYNHIVYASKRAGHRFGYVLCSYHHRGVIPEILRDVGIADKFGPSLIHSGSKPFHARYGSNQELLDYQDDLLGVGRKLIARVRKQYKSPTKVFKRIA